MVPQPHLFAGAERSRYAFWQYQLGRTPEVDALQVGAYRGMEY